MTLRKDDISLINKISDGQFDDFSSNTEDVVVYKKILEQSASWSLDADNNKEQSFEQILARIDKGSEKKTKPFFFLKIAASVALLIASIFLTYTYLDTNTLNADLTEIKTLYLPDSSKVILNASSQLSYSISEWEEGDRTLSLSGQAYFEVKKGSKFTVKSKSGEVAVLGTSFNIYDRGGDFKVECFTGKVSVLSEDTGDYQKVILTKGLKTHKNKSGRRLIKAVTFNTIKSKEWTQGVFNFYNAPLREVFDELERQYDIEIVYDDDVEKFYTGSFKQNDLENSIINICKPMAYDYELKEKVLSIIIN